MRNEDLSYFESEDFKEALQQYEAALKEGRQIYMDADDLTDISEYYMVNEREDEANACISLAVALHPDATDPQIFLARQQMFHDNMDEAKLIASGIQQQDDRETKFLWAEINIKEGYPRKASKMLQRYYETLSEDRDLFLYDTACVFMDYNEWEIATQWARRLKEDFPKFERTDILLSDILVSCGKVEEALTLLENILEHDPFNSEAWKLTAEAQSAQEKYGEALESLDYLLAIDEHHVRGMAIRAHCLFHMGRMKEAHEQYCEVLKMAPKDVSYLYFDAVTLTALEQFDKALEQLYYAKDLCEDGQMELSHILIHISYVLSKKGKHQEAVEILENTYKNEERPFDNEYYLLKGHIMLESGDINAASACFDLALSHSDDINTTSLTMAIEYTENEYYEYATNILEVLVTASDMPQKEERCLPYLAYCTYFIPGHPHHKTYLHLAAKVNPSLTEYLFSPIYPNTPVEEYGKI